MHKLTNVEAQRVMAVLGEMLDRLNYLSYIPTKADAELIELLRENQCDPVCTILDKQWHQEEVHSFLAVDEDKKAEESLKRVHLTTRNLCRELRENPVSVETLYHVPNHERSAELTGFVQTLSELTDITYQKLLSTVEDETSKKKLMSGISHRKKHAEAEMIALQKELASLREAKNREVSVLEGQSLKLKSEIQDINQNAAYELRLIETEMKESLEKSYEEHKTLLTGLQVQTDNIQKKLAEVNIDHRADEQALRKKKCKIQAELKAWVDKYDTEMTAKMEEIESIKQKYEQEKNRFDELSEYFQKIDEEQARIDAEERELEEIRNRDKQAELKLQNAATAIQKIFRGVIARREYKKIASKKKGKKGKKK